MPLYYMVFTLWIITCGYNAMLGFAPEIKKGWLGNFPDAVLHDPDGIAITLSFLLCTTI
jgi:hypothetical protein